MFLMCMTIYIVPLYRRKAMKHIQARYLALEDISGCK
jgi:hypothetical protein